VQFSYTIIISVLRIASTHVFIIICVDASIDHTPPTELCAPHGSRVTTPPFTHFWHCGTGCRGDFFFARVKIWRTCTACMCVHVHLYFWTSGSQRATGREHHLLSLSLSRPNYHFTRPDNLSVRKNTPPDGIYYYIVLWV